MALLQSWSLAACEPSRAIFAASGFPSCWADCAIESPSVVTRQRANNVFMVSDVDDQLDQTIRNWRSQFWGQTCCVAKLPLKPRSAGRRDMFIGKSIPQPIELRRSG